MNSEGLLNESVRIQEYLEETEFVVDSVIRDGVHKVVAIYEYDKRAVNGAAFVYFRVKVRAADTPEILKMVDYHKSVHRSASREGRRRRVFQLSCRG